MRSINYLFFTITFILYLDREKIKKKKSKHLEGRRITYLDNKKKRKNFKGERV